MKVRKLLLSALCIVGATASFAGFTACNTDNDGHDHSYSESWTYDKDNLDLGHWHGCIVEGCNQVSGTEAHKWDEGTVTKEVTCIADGEVTYKCTVCEATRTETVQKTGKHTLSAQWSKSAEGHWHNCTTDGCTNKDAVAEHTYGNWQTVTPATEDSKGSEKRVCSVCNYEDTRDIAKLPHTHKYEAGWSSDASGHWHAATCDDTDAQTSKSGTADHTYGEWVVTKQPTEDEEGTKERECSVCKYKQTDSVGKLNHTHNCDEEQWAKDASGHWHECSGCTEKVALAQHTYGNWQTVTPATENSKGSEKRVCSVCHYEDTKEVPALVHALDVMQKDASGHWYSCANCNVTGEVQEHTYNWTTVTAATEDSKGSEKGTCTVCNYETTRETDKLPHTHKYAEAWSSDPNNHWHEAICDDLKNGGAEFYGSQASHDWDNGKVTKQATCTNKPEVTYTCKVCGRTKTLQEGEINESAHEWREDYECRGSVHVKVCKYNGNHVSGAETHDENGENGSCSVCGAVKGTHTVTVTDTEGNLLAGHSFKITTRGIASTNEVVAESITTDGEGKLTFEFWNTNYDVEYLGKAYTVSKKDLIPTKFEGTVKLEAKSLLTVTVPNAGEGVTVNLCNFNTNGRLVAFASGTTDAQGVAEIFFTKPANANYYYITVEYDNTEYSWTPAEVTGINQPCRQVSANEQTVTVENFYKLVVYKLTFVDENGDALPSGVTVTLKDKTQTAATATIGANGVAQFDKAIPAKEYTISLSDDYATETKTSTQAEQTLTAKIPSVPKVEAVAKADVFNEKTPSLLVGNTILDNGTSTDGYYKFTATETATYRLLLSSDVANAYFAHVYLGDTSNSSRIIKFGKLNGTTCKNPVTGNAELVIGFDVTLTTGQEIALYVDTDPVHTANIAITKV